MSQKKRMTHDTAPEGFFDPAELDRDTCDLIDAVKGKAPIHRDKALAAWTALATGAPLSRYEPFMRAVAEQVVAVEEHARHLSTLPKSERKSPQVLNSARIKNLGGCLGLGGTPDKYARIRKVIDEADTLARLSDPHPTPRAGAWILPAAEIKRIIAQHSHLLPAPGPDAAPGPDELLASIQASTKRGASPKK